MEELKRKLSGQYRSGCRWLVYDTRRSSGWLDRLYCFAGYSGAVAFSRAKSGREGVYRILVLSDTLAGLNGVRPATATPAERLRLHEQLAVRPISGYTEAVPLESGLLRQKYFPVLWNRWLDPLIAVDSYQLIHQCKRDGGKTRMRVLDSVAHFTMAVTCFMAAARRVHAPGEERLLIGRLFGEPDLRDGDQVPEGVLVFYRSKPGGSDGKGVIEQVHDPVQHVMVRVPYFAGYDRRHGVIAFYDGMLKRVQPLGI